MIAIVIGATVMLSKEAGDAGYAVLVMGLCISGLVFAKFLSDWLLAKDDGTPEMRQVSEPIREGAAGL